MARVKPIVARGCVPASCRVRSTLVCRLRTGDDRRVRFLFLDESGKIEDGRLFALGGIAVRDTDWATLRDLWQGTLRAAGWPLDREVKWRTSCSSHWWESPSRLW